MYSRSWNPDLKAVYTISLVLCNESLIRGVLRISPPACVIRSSTAAGDGLTGHQPEKQRARVRSQN